jgi:hypothetical protein
MDEALRKQYADGGARPTDLRSGFARAVSASAVSFGGAWPGPGEDILHDVFYELVEAHG